MGLVEGVELACRLFGLGGSQEALLDALLRPVVKVAGDSVRKGQNLEQVRRPQPR